MSTQDLLTDEISIKKTDCLKSLSANLIFFCFFLLTNRRLLSQNLRLDLEIAYVKFDFFLQSDFQFL